MDLKNKKILVTGGNGFLGRRVVHFLNKMGNDDIVIPSSKKLDFTPETTGV